MWHKHWTETIYVCQWPIFHGPGIFALYLEDYLMDKCHNWNSGSMWHKDLPHKMYVGQWPTFHYPVILSYILKTIWWINVVLEVLINVTQTLNWNYVCRPVTCISWSSDFVLYLEDYLMDKCHNWNIGSMWCKDLPHKIYVGQWDHIKCMWVSDLHFMVQWFCHIWKTT